MLLLRAFPRLSFSLSIVLVVFAIEAHCATRENCKKITSPDSEKQCIALATQFKPSGGLEINNTFTQYFGEGSMPSLEKLVSFYPPGTIPAKVKVPTILTTVGPDVDFKCDAGYARTDSRAGRRAPAGGMPAFCRFGAYIKTSPITNVFMEVWMPLASDPKIPLVPFQPSDFPTDTTSAIPNKDGTLERAPLYVTQGLFDLPMASLKGDTPLEPNAVPLKIAKAEDKTIDKSGYAIGGGSLDNTGLKEDVGTSAKANVKHPLNSKTSGFKAIGNDQSLAKEDERLNTEQKKNSINNLTKRHANQSSSRTLKHKHHHSRSNKPIKGEDVIGSGTGWNNRIAMLGNGAQRGFLPLPDMKQYMTRYSFAVVGNNGGHWSSASAVTWINGTQFTDTLTDFASRANHVSLQLAEQVIDNFYGKTEGIRLPNDDGRVARYYLGSSVGGGRGLSSIQVYPKDFNGHLIGAPAIQFANMNVGQLSITRVHNKTEAGKGWFTQGALRGPIKQTVIEQCDELDGVKDGIISDPFRCQPNLEKELLCGGKGKYSRSTGTCLTQEQITNAYRLYNETWLDGNFVYPAYLPGLEDSAASMEASNKKASGWYQLVVLEQDKLDKDFNPFKDMAYAALTKGNEKDPGGFNAAKTDLSEYIKSGGKVMLYHGLVDLVISPVATINYFEEIKKVNGPEFDNHFRLYLVPGMQHSRGGAGAVHFGAPTHRFCGNRPLVYDTDHDILLALLAWVEEGKAPQEQIAATYERRESFVPEKPTPGTKDEPVIDMPISDTFQNYNWGVVNTRLLCPYPTKAKYQGGPTTGRTSHKSFVCA